MLIYIQSTLQPRSQTLADCRSKSLDKKCSKNNRYPSSTRPGSCHIDTLGFSAQGSRGFLQVHLVHLERDVIFPVTKNAHFVLFTSLCFIYARSVSFFTHLLTSKDLYQIFKFLCNFHLTLYQKALSFLTKFASFLPFP